MIHSASPNELQQLFLEREITEKGSLLIVKCQEYFLFQFLGKILYSSGGIQSILSKLMKNNDHAK